MKFSVLWCIEFQLITDVYKTQKYDCVTTFFLKEIDKSHGRAGSVVEKDVIG